MNERLSWFALCGSSAAILISSWLPSPLALWPLACGVALFPGALFLVAEGRRRRPPLWLVGLTLSLMAGMLPLLLDWDGGSYWGLPLSSWLTALLLGLLPFLLTVYGVVFASQDGRGEEG